MLPLSRSSLQRYRVDDRRRPDGVPYLNRDSPQARGLVGFFPLILHPDKNLGSRGEDLIAVGITPRISPLGRGYDFDGSSTQYVSKATDFGFSDGNQPLTVSAWAYSDVAATTQYLFSFGLNNSSGFLGIGLHSSGVVRFAKQTDVGVQTNTDSITTWTNNQIYQIFFRQRAVNDRDMGINGVVENSSSVSSSLSQIDFTTIGALRRNTLAVHFNGIIGHVCIWDRAITDAEIWSLHNPATRWDLYWRPRLMVPGFVAAGAGDQNIAGSLLEDSDTLNHGKIDLNLNGSLFEDADNLHHGLISPYNQFGTLFTDDDNIFDGLLSSDIGGSFLQDVDSLYHGNFAVIIINSLFQDEDILYHGEFNVSIGGSLF